MCDKEKPEIHLSDGGNHCISLDSYRLLRVSSPLVQGMLCRLVHPSVGFIHQRTLTISGTHQVKQDDKQTMRSSATDLNKLPQKLFSHVPVLS